MSNVRSDGKVLLVGAYKGVRTRWAVGRIMDEGRAGPYMIGAFVADGGVVFYRDKTYTSRENAEAHLVYRMDKSVNL